MDVRYLLLVSMFLLIFGPKTSGWIDVVSITSIVLVAVHFLRLNTAHFPRAALHRATVLGCGFLLLLAVAGLHYWLQTSPSAYQVLRFGRVVVNLLGVTALVSMYVRWYGADASHVLLRHLLHCLVLHGLIMAGMFFSPGFRDLIVNHIVQADPDSRTYLAKATGYRIAGLTDSWDALSGLQSLGLLVLPVLLTHRPGLSLAYAAIAAPILLFSIAISGRTGFVTLLILAPLALRYTDFRQLHRTTLLGGAVAVVATLMVMGPGQQLRQQLLEDTSLGRTLAMFGLEYSIEGRPGERFSDTLAGIVSEHYFLPADWSTLVWGTGGSGRDPWDYVPADNGLVLNLHNLGAGCFLLIYGSIAWMIVSGLRATCVQPQVAGVCLLAVVLVLLIDIKVMYAFSRNGFSAMMIPVLATWCELSKPVVTCNT
jgi:hypothetical protein